MSGRLILFRRQIARRGGVDWRSLAGFGCGGTVGWAWGRALAGTTPEIALSIGVPWLVLKAAFVVIGGVALAGPIRKALEEAFPPRRSDKEDR